MGTLVAERMENNVGGAETTVISCWNIVNQAFLYCSNVLASTSITPLLSLQHFKRG
jgi:hypothetical protein